MYKLYESEEQEMKLVRKPCEIGTTHMPILHTRKWSTERWVDWPKAIQL